MNRLIITISTHCPPAQKQMKLRKTHHCTKICTKTSPQNPCSSLLDFFNLRHRKRDGWDRKLTCNFLQLDFFLLIYLVLKMFLVFLASFCSKFHNIFWVLVCLSVFVCVYLFTYKTYWTDLFSSVSFFVVFSTWWRELATLPNASSSSAYFVDID